MATVVANGFEYFLQRRLLPSLPPLGEREKKNTLPPPSSYEEYFGLSLPRPI